MWQRVSDGLIKKEKVRGREKEIQSNRGGV